MAESISDFAKRLSKAIGCYFTANISNYNLKKYNTSQKGWMGVFAWIHERKKNPEFWIATYKYLADDKAIAAADRIGPGMLFVSKKKDAEGKAAGLVYYVNKGSNETDYQKAVRALRTVCQNR